MITYIGFTGEYTDNMLAQTSKLNEGLDSKWKQNQFYFSVLAIRK